MTLLVNLALLDRVLLAAVLAASGIAKFFDRDGTREAAGDFGVPLGLRPALGWALPSVELLVAAGLLFRVSVWLASFAAACLLASFLIVLERAWFQGRRPACHCFGTFSDEPMSGGTVLRTALLWLCAFPPLILAMGHVHQPGLEGWLRALSRPELALFGVSIFALVASLSIWGLLLTVLAEYDRLLDRLQQLEAMAPYRIGYQPAQIPLPPPPAGLPVGMPAPAFDLHTTGYGRFSLSGLLAAGRPVVLVFVDPLCGPCRQFLPVVANWQRDLASRVTIAVVSGGDPAQNRQIEAEQRLQPVGLQQGREVADAYHAIGTPTAVLVDAAGRIASPVAAGAVAISALVAQSSALPAVPAQGQ